MLSEQERTNNAFKEAVFHEEMMAKKYSDFAKDITDPKLQKMLSGMEQACRSNYNTLSTKMSNMGISN
jgi:hypothetical protein